MLLFVVGHASADHVIENIRDLFVEFEIGRSCFLGVKNLIALQKFECSFGGWFPRQSGNRAGPKRGEHGGSAVLPRGSLFRNSVPASFAGRLFYDLEVPPEPNRFRPFFAKHSRGRTRQGLAEWVIRGQPPQNLPEFRDRIEE